MSFLEKLGLNPKKRASAPVIGEKKKQKEEASSFKKNVYLRAFILLAFLAILFLSIPQPIFEEQAGYSIGEPWKAEDLTAPFTFAIQKSDEEIKNEKEAIRQNTPSIFHRKQNVSVAAQSKVDSLFERIQLVLKAYQQWKQGDRLSQAATSKDSLNFIQKKNTSAVNLSNAAWSALIQNYQQTVIEGGRTDTKTAPSGQFIGSHLQNNITDIINNILRDGVINRPKEDLENSEITVRDLQNRTEQTFNTANVRDIPQASQYARYQLSQRYNEDILQAAIEIFNQVIRPNLIYSPENTQAQIEEALANVSTTKGAVAQEQVIIRKGDLITEEKYNMLQSLAEARSQNASKTERWLQFGGDVLAITAIVIIFFFYLYLYRRQIFMNNALLLLVMLTMSFICVGSSLIFQFTDISLYIVPIAIAPIILTIIFDSRLGILATVTLALLIGLINSNSFEFATATIVACCLGLFSVRDIKKRSQFFFTTPGIVFVSYTVVILGFSMAALQGWSTMLNDLLYVGVNAIFILFTYPLILLYEKTFKITTDLTLIELSDTNLPILKDLMNKAPGTFHHSLQVANLSEAAAGAIGANGLLCRVAALYHDIGKMENPAYFAENQVAGNEHDKLKPRMSALVIKAHVSNGVKVGRENKLPELIIDFIKTHHGTSVIKYFYEKAKEQCDDNKDEIQKEDFRYDGPLPETKETGILMLADGVEAASRAMKDPNYQKLENLIDKMVDDRVNEGQLSKTPLTFQNLRVIKETFLNILVGIYHSRVEYPEDEEQEGKDTSDQSTTSDGTDKKSKKKELEGRSQPKVDDYYNS
jgi:putative nucleotidyltransferase with HDIG domain